MVVKPIYYMGILILCMVLTPGDSITTSNIGVLMVDGDAVGHHNEDRVHHHTIRACQSDKHACSWYM